jgi:SAM-dependent methyltransferase
MDPSSYLSPQESKARYLLHNNYKEDERYTTFLSELAKPCMNFLVADSKSLDYGCGHTKVMQDIFNKEGFNMDSYDPVFYPDIKNKKYDLITCNEVMEHFYEPMEDLNKIYNLLNKKGILGIGLSLFNSDTNFNDWHYIKDPTHVSLYSFKTLAYIIQKFQFEILDTPTNRTLILRKL